LYNNIINATHRSHKTVTVYLKSVQLSGTALGHGVDDWGFESRQGLEMFIFTTASRPVLGSTQPPIQWVPGAISRGVKRPGRKADHSPPSSAEVKECVEIYLHCPNTPSQRGTQLKNRDFTFTFIIYLNNYSSSSSLHSLAFNA
jgi:hypothetical protein